MPAPNAISADKLVRLIGTPACPLLVDLGGDPAVPFIPGVVRRDPAGVRAWSHALPPRPVVVIDADGGAAAHAVAAWLRSDGREAEVLEGGAAGWRAAGHPLVATGRLPARGAEGGTLWVTRARPKVDRIACPWLIRRFVDPEARFLFVPAAEVLPVAGRTGAEPFDIDGEGVVWSHRGDLCTFDVMVEDFGLPAIAPLTQLAAIVRGADTDRLDLVPEAAGLLAVSLGLSRMYADDLAQLDAGMLVYDALYRWCRDARGETHNWASHAPAAAKVRA